MKLHQKFLILILICIIIFPLIELKSNAGLPPHYSGYIDIELKNYNNNDIKINSIDNKDMNLILSDNKIKTEHNQLACILFPLKQMKFNKYIIWLT